MLKRTADVIPRDLLSNILDELFQISLYEGLLLSIVQYLYKRNLRISAAETMDVLTELNTLQAGEKNRIF